MKKTLINDLLDAYSAIKCEEKCSTCSNRLKCDLLKKLIISTVKYNKR